MQVLNRKLVLPLFIPLALVTPYVFWGLVGITLFELLIIAIFSGVLIFSEQKKIYLPPLLKAYLLLFFLGWLGAVTNASLNWEIGVGLSNLKIFYFFLLAVAAYNVGYKYYIPLEDIFSSRIFKGLLIALIALILVYPYLSYAQRFGFLHFFYPPGTPESKFIRFHYARFPGLGVNANVYAFMMYTVFLFCFQAYLRTKKLRIILVGIFFAILITGSKSIFLITVISMVFLLLGSSSLLRVRQAKRIFISALGLICLTLLFVSFFKYSEIGQDVFERISVFQRISSGFDGNNLGGKSMEGRFTLWGMGMKRVELAPVLGIVPDRYVQSEEEALFFTTPHNEFIAFWMFYGILGLLAHIILLVWLFIMNLGQRTTLVWSIYYGALIIFISCDAAFSSVRFQPMFFMLVGMNIRFLQLLEREKTSVAQAKLAAAV